MISIVFISCVINPGWVGIGLGNGLVPQATSHYVSQWRPIPMSSSDVSGLGDGLVLVWVMAWYCWRQVITWATDNSYYVAMWRDLVNSSPASAAYTRQWTGSALVQIMTCRLSSAKPLPELMLVYCRMDSIEQISMILESKLYHVHSSKCIWNCHLPKWQPFCPREMSSNELTMTFILSESFLPGSTGQNLGFSSWNIASSNSTWFFHFNQNAYVHIYTTSVKVDFIPPIMCPNEQMFHIHLSWLLAIIALLQKYIHFDHYLVPGTFLIWYGFFCSVLVSVITNVMCMFKFNIYGNG